MYLRGDNVHWFLDRLFWIFVCVFFLLYFLVSGFVLLFNSNRFCCTFSNHNAPTRRLTIRTLKRFKHNCSLSICKRLFEYTHTGSCCTNANRGRDSPTRGIVCVCVCAIVCLLAALWTSPKRVGPPKYVCSYALYS